ncbi:MAG: helix-hairpin-helix domain-containing protein, partial [Muribaculaceae bacterium]|nr:helix-hairpin-helix domain-containing protein [Muribaculaceae bacterium]
LSYVSGIGPKLAETIVAYRNEHGAFKNRRSLMKVPRLGEKTFTQAAGFLRLPESDNPLDNTAVHPERYPLVEQMARDLHCTVSQLIASSDLRKRIDLQRYMSAEVGLPTLKDIMAELERPGRDPRGEAVSVAFDDTINDITDLKVGMLLPGVVNNITAFGAFVDIGIHQSGLVHVSELSDRFVSHPSEAVKLGQQILVKVIDIDLSRGRIGLSVKQAKG